MRKCYPFIKKNIRLCADVNEKTGKQTLIMRKLNDNAEIQIEETLDCIHTVVLNTKLNEISNDDFGKKTIEIISSEDLEELELSIDEKFKAFNSWVAGIAESDMDALLIQSEIEEEAHLIFPIIQPIMRFLALADTEILLNYLEYLERVCKFEGSRHNASLIANLNPILNLIVSDKEKGWNQSTRDKVLSAIFQINPPLELFSQNYKKIVLLKHPNAVEIEDFSKAFKHPNKYIRRKVSENPRITEFEEFNYFLNILTEPDYIVRMKSAANPKATAFKGFIDLLSYETEPDHKVRKEAAKNKNAINLNNFRNFINYSTEPNEGIRKIVAMRNDIENFTEFKNFFSYKTEPSILVRKNAARNQISPKFKEFYNFLDVTTEPNYEIRIIALLNSNFDDKKIILKLMDPKHEPIEEVRKFAKIKKINIENIEEKPKIVTKHDYDYYDLLVEELSDLQQEFDIDNQELIIKIKNLADILFPKKIEVNEDISRELRRLKRILAEKMPKRRFFSN